MTGTHGNKEAIMQIGRKIYYNKTTGEVVWDKGEMSGGVRETTFEEDKAIMPEIESADIVLMTLPYGDKKEEFRVCGGFTVDHKTQKITFKERKIEVEKTEIEILQEENTALKAEKATLLQTIAAKEKEISDLKKG